MESKKINQLATELAPDLSDLTIIGDPTTGISKKITLSQMASLFTGTVEEYATLAAFPLVGVADTIYIALDTNVIYRYDTSLSAYVILSPNVINSLVFSDANGFDGTITLVGSVATLSITTALTLGSVPFIGASGALTQDNANLFFDDTNNRLGIATALPTTPLDVFGSGIIGRLNATSTNNAYLGFASNGTNKWSAGNVQSDHRFRIFSEANSAELITILQTGEFGIGISNPTTKFHIDGAASALIANLDANVSVAKSVSYRSDNSARINLEVSGTESGSNAGADFFLRTFTDAGSLLETPFSIVRSTGVTTIKSLTLTNVLSVANGGTGSATQNFVDLTSTQSIGGAKTLTSVLAGTSASFSSTATATAFIPSGATVPTNGMYLSAANTLNFATNTTNRLSISSTGAATFSGSVSTGGALNITVPYSASTMTILTQDNLGNGIYLAPRSNLNFDYGVAGNTNGIINNFGYQNGSAHFRSLGIGNGKGGTIAFFDGTTSNVGIGTSSPAYPLDVRTASGNTYLNIGRASQTTGQVALQLSGGTSGVDWIMYQGSSSNDLQFYGNGAERMRITSGGNVLIGTTTDNGFNFVGATDGKHSYLGNTMQISASDYGGTERQGAFGVSEWANQSSAVINLASVFPRITFSSRALSVLVQIGTANTSTSHCSALVLFSRTSNGSWSSSIISNINNGGTVINSVSGSGTSITLNFNVATYGSAMITILNRA